MSESKEPIPPFLDVQDALAVAAIVNRLAASFDVKKELSNPEARVLSVLLVRAIDALLHAFPQELMRAAAMAGDGEPDPTDSN